MRPRASPRAPNSRSMVMMGQWTGLSCLARCSRRISQRRHWRSIICWMLLALGSMSTPSGGADGGESSSSPNTAQAWDLSGQLRCELERKPDALARDAGEPKGDGTSVERSHRARSHYQTPGHETIGRRKIEPPEAVPADLGIRIRLDGVLAGEAANNVAGQRRIGRSVHSSVVQHDEPASAPIVGRDRKKAGEGRPKPALLGGRFEVDVHSRPDRIGLASRSDDRQLDRDESAAAAAIGRWVPVYGDYLS